MAQHSTSIASAFSGWRQQLSRPVCCQEAASDTQNSLLPSFIAALSPMSTPTTQPPLTASRVPPTASLLHSLTPAQQDVPRHQPLVNQPQRGGSYDLCGRQMVEDVGQVCDLYKKTGAMHTQPQWFGLIGCQPSATAAATDNAGTPPQHLHTTPHTLP